MNENTDALKLKIQELLRKEITKFSLKGKGYCNNAYYVETRDEGKYIVKKEITGEGANKQENNLSVEARVIQQLYTRGLSISVPHIIFVSEDPKMFAYEYIEGNMMMGEWDSFSEDQKISVCQALGRFHAEIGKNFSKEMAKDTGIKLDESADVHPEVTNEYSKLIVALDVPDDFKILAKEAKVIFAGTLDRAVFQFIHNDSHHENIITQNKKISGIIDFGAAEYGEVAKEFSRYIRDYPDYFQYIVSAYEKKSGNNLSYDRLVSGALLCGFMEIVDDYRKGGQDRAKAEKAIATYRKLLSVQ
ncbi:MAG: aminoglycoside phosphotransferase family protein [Patescibacteria group bacterium]